MQDTATRLMRIVGNTALRLRAMDEDEAERPVLKGGWSTKQIIGHLIDSASNSHQRFVRTALAGRLEFPEYDQEGCVKTESFQTANWSMLVDLWVAYNGLLSHILASLPAEAAEFPCKVGVGAPMPLRELANAYVEHLLHHVGQLKLTWGSG